MNRFGVRRPLMFAVLAMGAYFGLEAGWNWYTFLAVLALIWSL